jgi:hypothetical protein
MARVVLAVLAAAGASMLLLVVASFVAMVMMVATNGMSEARVGPYASADLVAVAIANTVERRRGLGRELELLRQSVRPSPLGACPVT